MARQAKYKYTSSKYKKQAAQKLIELCLESMAPNVIADVTCKPRPADYLSLNWDIDDKRYIGYYDFKQPDSMVKIPKDWDERKEFKSNYIKRFWTSNGLIGRIRGLLSCPAFKNGSIVDRMALFITSEVNICFVDFRRVFRYIFGVRDAELYAALKELIKLQVVTIASMRDDDKLVTGPFILQAISCGMESLRCDINPEWQKRDGHGTWYELLLMRLISIDNLLMRMFMYCVDDLDDSWHIKIDHIKPFHALDQYYNRQKGSVLNILPYLCELMNIQTRDMDMAHFVVDTGDEYAEYLMRMYVLDEAIRHNAKKILDAISRINHPGSFQYVTFNQEDMKDCEETADESDIQQAIRILKDEEQSIPKDPKTGKVINAEKMRYILEKIPQIFSLKSLYQIFIEFDTDEEVVRREVRALCKSHRIVSPGRGLYCSIQYAEDHFGKVGVSNQVDPTETLGDSIQKSLMDRLEDALNILNKECSRLIRSDKG